MDYTFHIEQGQKLLEKKDSASIKKALEHFKKANEIIEDNDIGKPQVLYHLAIGNYAIGQIEQSYKVAHKAKRSIDTAIENSIFSMNNMRQMLGEDDIDMLINHINEKFPQVVLFTEINADDFDENTLDFSKLNPIHKSSHAEEINPEFSIENLDEEVITSTFLGLSRTHDELIYFDKLKGDVLSYVQGYFSSHIGDQSIANRRLANKISNSEPTDFVDEERYILIDRLKLDEFLDEYKKQTQGKEPFYSFTDYFSGEILKDFSYNKNLLISELAIGNHVQEKFHELFEKTHQNSIMELQSDYISIFQNTQRAVSLNWIRNKVLNKIEIDDKQLAKMSVKERYQLRRQRSENGDLKSLLSIAKYHFVNGSPATNESHFPEMCYYFGRLHQEDKLEAFLKDKEIHLFMLPEACMELAQGLFSIGYKFPNLNESEISYLEEKYSNSKTFELFDVIMFDCDRLARPIKKFNKGALNTKNTNFSREFLLKIYNCFSKNEDLDGDYDELYVYSRISNEIISKTYEDLGLGEYCIIQPILSNELCDLLTEKYSEECSDHFARSLSHDENWEDFKKYDFYLVDADNIEEVASEYFSNSSEVQTLKCDVAKHWLDKVNSTEINLT